MNRISIQHLPLQPTILAQKNTTIQSHGTQSFKNRLQEVTTNRLKISKHANDRMTERNILISDIEWKLVSEKVVEARTKGVYQP